VAMGLMRFGVVAERTGRGVGELEGARGLGGREKVQYGCVGGVQILSFQHDANSTSKICQSSHVVMRINSKYCITFHSPESHLSPTNHAVISRPLPRSVSVSILLPVFTSRPLPHRINSRPKLLARFQII
jgi:hypothetical protein